MSCPVNDTDRDYLECGLPAFLQESVDNMKESWAIIDAGQTDTHWDLKWGELASNINVAEVGQAISGEQADYLRRKYLRVVNEI